MTVSYVIAPTPADSTSNVANNVTASFDDTGANGLYGVLWTYSGTPAAHSAMKWGGSTGDALTQVGTTQAPAGSPSVRMSLWQKTSPAQASRTLYGEAAATQSGLVVAGIAFSGIDTANPATTLSSAGGVLSNAFSTDVGLTLTTAVGDTVCYAVGVWDNNGSTPIMTPNGTPGATGRAEVEGVVISYAVATVVATGTSTALSCNIAPTSSNMSGEWGMIAWIIPAGSTATTEQTRYKFRNDDGSETAATNLGSENTAVSRAVAEVFRLRVQVDTTGDLASTQFQIGCKKSTDSAYQKIIAAPSQQVDTITTVGAGTWVCPPWVTSIKVETWGGGGAGARSTTNNQGRGGGRGGDYARRNAMAVTPGTTYNLTVGAGGTGGATPTNGGQTTFTGDSSVVCSAAGGNSAAVNTSAGATTANGTTTGDVTFTGGSGGTGTGTTSGGGGEGASSTANGVAASGGTAGTSGGDGGDGAAGRTTQGVGAAGTAPGGGGAGAYRTNASQDGGAGGAGQIKITYTAAPPFVLQSSSNIASGGSDATTAQLTAPSGKTTSDFQAGGISDDTNPLLPLDLATSKYTELEWCLSVVNGNVTVGDVYQFRVTKAGAALDTYTVTPQVTIVAAGLVGAATDTATATGNLTAQIKLAGSAADVATATGGLAGTAAALAGAATDVATATGDLTVPARTSSPPQPSAAWHYARLSGF